MLLKMSSPFVSNIYILCCGIKLTLVKCFLNWFQFYFPLFQITVMNTWQKKIQIEQVLKFCTNTKFKPQHYTSIYLTKTNWIIFFFCKCLSHLCVFNFSTSFPGSSPSCSLSLQGTGRRGPWERGCQFLWLAFMAIHKEYK